MYIKTYGYSLKVFFLSIILLYNFNSFAQKTDVVIMQNDDHITGEIKKLEVGILVFKTDDAGTLDIKWNKVKSIETKNIYEVELVDGRVYYGYIEPGESEGTLIIKGVTLETRLFMEYIVKITRIRESFWDIIDGYIKLGVSYTKANEIGQLSFGFNGKYRTKVAYSELDANSVITTTGGKSTSIKQDINITHRRFMEGKWFYAGFVGAEENTELGLQLRANFGGGFGNNFIQDNHHLLLATAGLSLNREWYIDSTKATNNIEVMLTSQYLLFVYDSPKISLEPSLNVYPSITNFGRIRTNFDIDLNWEIFLDFYWVLSFYFNSDSKPTSNSSPTDYRIESTIKYEL